MIFRWETAPYTTSGQFADICMPNSAVTHRLYANRTYQGSQKWMALIDGRRIKGTFGSRDTAKAALEEEAKKRYPEVCGVS